MALFSKKHEAIFTHVETKAAYKCDAYFVDLGKPPHLIVADACYWTGLLSHQRVSALWKGLLVVPLQSNDSDVKQILAHGGNNAPQN